MTSPFQPADGDKGRWRYCYELAASRKTKEAILYQEVEELLQCSRVQALQAMYEARRHLEADKICILRTVQKYGWVIEDATGSIGVVEGRRKKAARATTRAIRGVNAIDREQLSQIERAQLDFNTRNLLAAQSIYTRRPREVIELEAESNKRRSPELPFRRKSEPA